MTLEQRIEALEKSMAKLTLPDGKTEELAKAMRDITTSVIKNEQRPGGCLYEQKDGKATISQAASVIKTINKEGVVTTRLSKI
ncbi:hypothetical protein [Pseudescherichia sp.]|uniref:hypothetical protein n=1 Tax=Pseudescherichia sp. TaxID=2055881 RepID=UPI0028966671|nr:hypothetical protein [Pseudescherichia sp.]WPO96925.1 hypothetical protein SFA32_08275 [Buttiauxella sp. HR94]